MGAECAPLCTWRALQVPKWQRVLIDVVDKAPLQLSGTKSPLSLLLFYLAAQVLARARLPLLGAHSKAELNTDTQRHKHSTQLAKVEAAKWIHSPHLHLFRALTSRSGSCPTQSLTFTISLFLQLNSFRCKPIEE